jgi:hypothetical protein
MNFTVPCSPAGDTAIVEFGFDDLVALQEAFGDGYALTIANRLRNNDAAALRTCLTIGGHGGDFEAAMKASPFAALAEIVGQALTLRLVGNVDDAD